MTTPSTFRRRVRYSLLLAALFFIAADARAQANHNVTRSNQTQPAAGNHDNDCDGVCGTVRGHVHAEGSALVLVIEQAGGATRVPLAGGDETDIDTLTHPTPIYMSINDGGVHLAETGTGASGTITVTAASERAQDYNNSRSNRTGRVSEGSLEHTDDWIAARATTQDDGSTGPAYTKDFNSARSNVASGHARTAPDSFFDVTFLHIPTDVHSGRLTGVRQHSPFKVHTASDASAVARHGAEVDGKGGFIVKLPATPGTYRIVVTDGRGRTHRGHVTVLK